MLRVLAICGMTILPIIGPSCSERQMPEAGSGKPAQQLTDEARSTGGRFFSKENIAVTKLTEGASSRLITSDRVMVSLLELEPNMSFPNHNHAADQLMFVLKGSMIETVGGVSKEVGPGDIVWIPSNVVHSGETGPEGCEIMDVFAPPRADYVSSGLELRD